MSKRFLLLLALLVWGGPERAPAGGGPQNVLVIVNDNSPASLELGAYYQALRGLHPRQVFHVQTTTNPTITLAAFSNEVIAPVHAYLASSGLSNQIDYLALTHGMPYRVTDASISSNGASSVLFYGFKADGAPWLCPPTAAARSDYFNQERAFTHAGAPSSNRYYLSTILTGHFLDECLRALDRARLSDASAPTGLVALMHSDDPARGVRWTQFDDVLFASRFRSNGVRFEARDGTALGTTSNVLGYLTGTTVVTGLLTVGWVPGALADHLTSYGGYIQETNPDSQMSILRWIHYGAAGTYGTIVEPYRCTNKFPQARLHYWYGRGFNLAESYGMAVQYPYMGIVVGDPLTAPFAAPPAVEILGLSPGGVATGDLPLTFTATGAGGTDRVSRLDLLLDGLWLATLEQTPPRTDNEVSVTLDGTTRTYTVTPGNVLEQVASGLAARINANPPLPYRATAFGDRVEILHTNYLGTGAWISVSATSTVGSATQLTVFARSVFTNFLESDAFARTRFTLQGASPSGALIRMKVTRMDGAVITNEVAALTNDTSSTVLYKIIGAINSNPALASVDGCRATWSNTTLSVEKEAWLVARTNGWQGALLHMDYAVINNPGSSLSGTTSGFFRANTDVLGARATIFLTEGFTNLTADWTLPVGNLPDGPHELEVVAFAGSAVRVQGHARLPFIVDRHDLACAITTPPPRRAFLRGSVVTAEVAATSPGTVTQVVLFAEGKAVATNATAPASFALATTSRGAGTLALQALARDDAGRAALSEEVRIQLFTDDDADGLPDQWEYHTLGSKTNATASGDADADGLSNLEEYLAGTDPRDAASLLTFRAIDGPEPVSLTVPATTSRLYRIEYTDDDLRLEPWLAATNPVTPGTGTTAWVDGTGSSLRIYRLRSELP